MPKEKVLEVTPNPFLMKMVKGKKATLSLREVLIAVLGYTTIHGSKRLAPAMCLCNARIYSGKKLVWHGDLDVYKFRSALARVAELFALELKVYSEAEQKPSWSSKTQDLWLGYCFGEASPQPIEEVYPLYQDEADKQRKQWLLDHGFTKPKKKKKKATL